MLLPGNFRTQDPLSNLSVKFMNDQQKYAALKVLPPFLVPKSTFKFYQYNKSNLTLDKLDAPSGTEARIFDYDAFTNVATTKEYAAGTRVHAKDARDFDAPVADLRLDAAQLNAEKLLIHMEDAMYTKISTTGNYPAALTTASGGWDVATSDPIEDVRVARQAVFEKTGLRPSEMALNQKALDLLKNHPAIVDRIKFVGMLGAAEVVRALSSLFEMQNIHVSDVLKNTAQEGATDSLSTIWGSTCLIYTPANGGLRSNGYGRTFMTADLQTKIIDRPELGRGSLGVEDLVTSWEWTQEFICQAGDSDADSHAGYLLTSLY